MEHCDLLFRFSVHSLSLNKCCQDPDRSHLGRNWKQSYHKGAILIIFRAPSVTCHSSNKHIWAVAFRDLLMTLWVNFSERWKKDEAYSWGKDWLCMNAIVAQLWWKRMTKPWNLVSIKLKPQHIKMSWQNEEVSMHTVWLVCLFQPEIASRTWH